MALAAELLIQKIKSLFMILSKQNWLQTTITGAMPSGKERYKKQKQNRPKTENAPEIQ